MTPLVSVVIPAYNVAPYIGASLDSVLSQTYGNYEIVVVNDASTDDTERRLAPYLALPCVSYLRQPQSGPSAARNAGLRLAKGELVAFLDADDLWLPRHLAEAVALFERQQDAGVVHGDMFWWHTDQPFDPQSCITFGALHYPGCHLAAGPGKKAFLDVLEGRAFFGPPCTWVLRRAVLLQVGAFNEQLRYGEDTELSYRLLLSGVHVAPLPGPTAIYRRRLGSLTAMARRGQGALVGIELLRALLRNPQLSARERLAVKRALRLHARRLRGAVLEMARTGSSLEAWRLLWVALRVAPSDIKNIALFFGLAISPRWSYALARYLHEVWRSR